jgi:hypothetical protein
MRVGVSVRERERRELEKGDMRDSPFSVVTFSLWNLHVCGGMPVGWRRRRRKHTPPLTRHFIPARGAKEIRGNLSNATEPANVKQSPPVLLGFIVLTRSPLQNSTKCHLF